MKKATPSKKRMVELMDEIKLLDKKRRTAKGLTKVEEKKFCKLNSELTGFPEKVFTTDFEKKLTSIIQKTDKFIKEIKSDIPKKDDKIYVPSSLYMSHGADDFAGGIATISKVEYNEKLSKDHVNYCFIGIKERPGCMYNYKDLLSQQKELKKSYKKQIAHPDPDLHPDANRWD